MKKGGTEVPPFKHLLATNQTLVTAAIALAT